MSQFAGFEAEDKQDGINDIGLSIAVGTYDAVEMRIERSKSVLAEVGLEVVDFELMDDHDFIMVLVI